MRLLFPLLIVSCLISTAGAESRHEALSRDFDGAVLPFLKEYCLGCHGKTRQEAKLDLSSFGSIAAVQQDFGHWELVLERLEAGEMPPDDAAKQPSKDSRAAIVTWIRDLRQYEASRNAGDPGDILPRRLNNTEYDNTIRDLTGVDIRPTREFPVDPGNMAGFANSGESLAMSPALFNKYLAAARRVADHLVLLPSGFTFAPHPAVIYSDRDKFAVRRVIDFYQAQKTDYAEFLLAAWRFEHRQARGEGDLTLAVAADAQGVSRKYLNTLWEVLHDGQDDRGPIAELRKRWNALPAPDDAAGELPVDECRGLRDWIVQERKKREFTLPLVLIPQLNPSTQPGVLWKNRLIAENRRKGKLTDEERKNEPLRRAIERFCSVFPDHFMLTERGRMNLPFEKQNKGRLLGAGFHLQIGYYRDDAPLYEMLLTDEQQHELDRLWGELYFVTDVLVRQFQDYIYFERAEGREVITEAEFDFARGEDRTVTSPESMEKFSRLYVAAVTKRGLEEEAIKEIERYFAELSKRIQAHERSLVEAEPVHLQALLKFAANAWRRPLTADEDRELLKFYRQLREESELSHEQAIRDVVASVLVSPYFCYRVDAAKLVDGDYRLTGFSVANRLSYFLWSSMPDEKLKALAAEGKLHQPDVLAQQVQRMLQDPKAQALAIEFAGNWLDFRHFQSHVGVDRTKFSQFTDELRESMYQEPIHFIEDWVRRDGSVRELLEARHTFVDQNLAKHYGIPYSAEAADANGWMRIDDARALGRGGLLPMAVFLTKSSPGLRTSPVKRGYWVIKQLLGERIPAPPPNVPELPKNEAELGDLTLRQALARHREIKSCAACHVRFDFAGLVFEGYGPIGQRRSQDLGGKPIDDSTEFPNGRTGNGLAGLQSYLREQRFDQFQDNFCRKLLTYGLGRGLLLSDEPTIDQMKLGLAENEGRFSSLVEVIVTSRQFLNKRPLKSEDQASPAKEP